MSSKREFGINIDKLVKEAILGLFEDARTDDDASNMKEKLRQSGMADANKKLKNRFKKDESTGDAGDAGDENIPEDSKPIKIKHEKLPEINAQAIADKINELRSGKSLKEKETMSALKGYFEKLNGPERIALFAFLSGLNKVLGSNDATAKAPHAKPYNIDMEQEKPKDKKIKPTGTKDTSLNDASENPIIVGESADKRQILETMNKNRRIS